jgi:hypothetical protein
MAFGLITVKLVLRVCMRSLILLLPTASIVEEAHLPMFSSMEMPSLLGIASSTHMLPPVHHSEYNALALGAKEAEWQLLLFSQLDPGNHAPIPIYVDNSGIISMVFNPVDHQSNKHVKVGTHYTRELTANKIISPLRISTDANIADAFTKALAAPVLNKLIPSLVSAAPQQVSALMFSTSNTNAEEEKHVPSFQVNWPFLSVLQRELGADSHQVLDSGERFSTGRKKLEVVYWKDLPGHRVEVSRHSAMQLTNKEGTLYYVVSRSPKLTQAQPFGSFQLSAPTPAITCTSCKVQSTQLFSMIACACCGGRNFACCGGRNFAWSCECTGKAPVVSSSLPPALPATIITSVPVSITDVPPKLSKE